MTIVDDDTHQPEPSLAQIRHEFRGFGQDPELADALTLAAAIGRSRPHPGKLVSS